MSLKRARCDAVKKDATVASKDISVSKSKGKDQEKEVAVKQTWAQLKAREAQLENELQAVRKQLKESKEGQDAAKRRIVAWANYLSRYDADEAHIGNERPPAKLKDLIIQHVTNVVLKEQVVTDLGVYNLLSYRYDGKFVELGMPNDLNSRYGPLINTVEGAFEEASQEFEDKPYSRIPESRWAAIRASHIDDRPDWTSMIPG